MKLKFMGTCGVEDKLYQVFGRTCILCREQTHSATNRKIVVEMVDSVKETWLNYIEGEER